MDLFLACLHGAAYVATGLALPLPGLRRPAIALLLLAAAAGLLTGALDPAVRTLQTVHTYAGFEGSSQEVSMRAFPTGTASAAGWLWPLPFAGFALLWAGVLWALRSRAPKSPWLLPLVLCWTATAQWLGMQWFAGPAAAVQPLGLDRVLFPAGVGAALLVARRAKGFFALLVTLSGLVLLGRLPAAFFSKFASDHHLGTCLDVSTVRDIVNPMNGLQFDPRLVPGSPEQQYWLIWLEHVIMFPALHLLSLTGIAFGAWMYHKHGGED